MAVLVAIGGAAIGGSVFGSASAGWVVGSILGNLLFSPKNKDQEGARLDDLSVISSAYGVAIPKNFGTVRLSGNIIWALPVRELKKTEKQGGKGGGAQVTTYTYFATFAVGLSQGVASRVLRIWANEKLIYDTGSPIIKQEFDQETLSRVDSTVSQSEGNVSAPSLDFNFYTGSEDQQTDPLIEADKGIEAIPYKGLCYIVINDIPLADYGNAVPSITAEIVYKDPEVFEDGATLTETASVTVEPNEDSSAVDWARRKAYGAGIGSRIIKVDLDTMTELTSGVPTTPFTNSSLMVSRVDGFLYGSSGSSNSRPIIRIDPNSITITDTFGFLDSSTNYTTDNFVAPRHLLEIVVQGANGERSFIISSDIIGRGFGILAVGRRFGKTDFLNFLISANVGNVSSMCRGKEILGQSDAYIGVTKLIYKVEIDYDSNYFPQTNSVYRTPLTNPFAFADREILELFWDEEDNNLIVHYVLDVDSTEGFIKLNTIDWSTIWDTGGYFTVSVHLEQGSVSHSFYKGGVGVFGYGISSASFIELKTGKVISSTNIPELDSHGTTLVFNYSTMEGIKNNGAVGIGKIEYFSNSSSGQRSADLSEIVTFLCNKVGIQSADIDVTELTDVIDGFTINSVSSARNWLDMLARIYFFEGSESDYKLKFPKKEKPSSQEVPIIDLIKLGKNNSGSFSVNSIQEPELPVSIEFNFIDRLTTYNPGTVRSKRIVEPSPTVFSNNKINFGAPIVLTPITAKQIAETSLYTSWLERDNYQWTLPYKYLKLDATDVVTVTTNLGVFTPRITKLEFSGDMSINLAGVSHEEAMFTSYVDGDGGVPIPQTIPGNNVSNLTMLALPLLSETQETFGIGLVTYFVITGIGQPGWQGSFLYRSTSSTIFNEDPLEQITSEATTGLTTTVLGDFDYPNVLDTVNSVTFSISTGSNENFSSITVLEMYNNQTTALLVGNEIIKYSTVVISPQGLVTVSGLIRGRKNTENFMDSHTIGENVILLDPNTIGTITESVNNLNKDFFYKAVGFNEFIDTTKVITQKSLGEAEKPFSVVQISQTPSGSDTVISWVRRSRIDSSALRDGVSYVALGEDFERYELDIEHAANNSLFETFIIEDTTTFTILEASKLSYIASLPPATNVLIQNPDAEVGNISNWVKTDSSPANGLNVTTVSPNTGTYAFRMAQFDSYLDFYQDVIPSSADFNLVLAGAASITLSWYSMSITDLARTNRTSMRIQCLDENDLVLQSLVDDYHRSPDVYTLYSLTINVPVNTAKFRIYILGDRLNGGVDPGTGHLNNDAGIRHDDITLTLTPPPLTDFAVKVYQISNTVGRGRQTEQITFPI